MQLISVLDLKEHPKNKELFDEMTGDKWNEFVESIKTSGVIEPIVVTQDLVIVSGHQRLRACIELGIETVNCEVRHYDNDDLVLKDLIETNLRQRGDIGGSQVKMARRIRELERIYGIQRGNNQSSGGDMTQKKLSDMLGISEGTLLRVKKLLDLLPEIQDEVESGKISFSTASRLISQLDLDEQKELYNQLFVENSNEDVTNAEIVRLTNLLKQKEEEHNKELAIEATKLEKQVRKVDKLENEIEELKKSSVSGALIDEKNKLEIDNRTYYERYQAVKQANTDLNKKLKAQEDEIDEAYRLQDEATEKLEQIQQELDEYKRKERLARNEKSVINLKEGVDAFYSMIYEYDINCDILNKTNDTNDLINLCNSIDDLVEKLEIIKSSVDNTLLLETA